MFDLIFPLYTQTDSVLSQFCLYMGFFWKKKAYINFLFLELLKSWSFPVLSLNPFYHFPFLGWGQGCEHWGEIISEDLKLSPPSSPKSIYTFMSLVQRYFFKQSLILSAKKSGVLSWESRGEGSWRLAFVETMQLALVGKQFSTCFFVTLWLSEAFIWYSFYRCGNRNSEGLNLSCKIPQNGEGQILNPICWLLHF